MFVDKVGAVASFGLARNVRVWGVFALCFVFSGIGVGASFWLFSTTIPGLKLWGIGIVIAAIMLGISYGAKYANAEARTVFTPVDLIQYLSQGFLWPSTWPAMADLLGVQQIAPPETSLIDVGSLLLPLVA